jgi:hypothetical protein
VNVIWFFDKDGKKLRCEMTLQGTAGPYRLVVTDPDGRVSIEEVNEPLELIQRSLHLVNSLKNQGWRVT